MIGKNGEMAEKDMSTTLVMEDLERRHSFEDSKVKDILTLLDGLEPEAQRKKVMEEFKERFEQRKAKVWLRRDGGDMARDGDDSLCLDLTRYELLVALLKSSPSWPWKPDEDPVLTTEYVSCTLGIFTTFCTRVRDISSFGIIH